MRRGPSGPHQKKWETTKEGRWHERPGNEIKSHPKLSNAWPQTCMRWGLLVSFRKSLMSVIFPPANLGPQLAAPILWAPGIYWCFLLENSHAQQIPRSRGGGSWVFLEGGVEVPILFLWAWGFFRLMCASPGHHEDGSLHSPSVNHDTNLTKGPCFTSPACKDQDKGG